MLAIPQLYVWARPLRLLRLPVVFWIHGGGLVDGESNDYDASKLASDGKTVVVTINYRLSLLGWFAHPALDAEGHLFADYGTLDQQLAMKWVQRNIAKFGGDKNNVTVGGQSSGASSTGSNVISPLAAGLFDRAILESGSAYIDYDSIVACRDERHELRCRSGLRLRHRLGDRQMSARADCCADHGAVGNAERQWPLHHRA